MAVLPSSGALSINDIAGVMGGTAPHSLSEYYRGGGLVPSTKTVTTSEGPFGSLDVYHFSQGQFQNTIYWNSVLIVSDYSNAVSSVLVGSTTYVRGSLFYTYTDPETGFTQNYYQVSRSYPTTVNINGSVPTSGQISISNFYGAEKP
jgi:hypothetical protein